MGADSGDEGDTEAVEEQLAGTLITETADNNQLIALGAKARLANLKK